jgi:hypothetical protein
MTRYAPLLLCSLLLLGQGEPAPGSPYQYTPKLARSETQKMYGQLVWTTIRKSGLTVETSTHTVKGAFIRHRSTAACYEMPQDALDEKAITFKAFEGTVTAEVFFEDKADYSDMSTEDREQQIKWTRKTTVLPVRMSEKEAREGLYFYQYGPTERVTMGCVTMNPETGHFWLAPPWTNNMDSWVTASHVTAKAVNQNNRAMPFPPEAPAGYRFLPPPAFTEGRYNPKSDTYTGTWSKLTPPSPGPDDDYLEHRLVWTLSYKELEEVVVTGPRCACKPDEVLSYKGSTKLMGGKFEKFEVTSDGTGPQVLKNEGGDFPQLQLKGDAKSTGRTRVVAVYKDTKGQLQRSKPFEVNFCELEGKPDLVHDPDFAPTSDHEAYVYDKSPPGYLEVKAEAKNVKLWLSGKEQPLNQLLWEIKTSSYQQFVPQADDAKKKVTFVSKGLPRLVRDFGKKELTVSTAPSECECKLTSEPARLKVFFPVNETANVVDGKLKNNPEGREPNWLYYWKQTSAWVKPPAYQYTEGRIPDPPIGSPSHPNEAARYNQFTDVLWLSNRLMAFGAPAPAGEALDATRWGIDALATAMRHELAHREEFLQWWGPKMANYKLFAYWKDQPGLKPWEKGSNDCDFDMVPDQVEAKARCLNGCSIAPPAMSLDPVWLGLMKGSQHSCPSRPKHIKTSTGTLADLPDLELNAYNVGWLWQRGQADSEDWSYPGRQCDEGTCQPQKP